jgi:hypothetical protein
MLIPSGGYSSQVAPIQVVSPNVAQYQVVSGPKASLSERSLWLWKRLAMGAANACWRMLQTQAALVVVPNFPRLSAIGEEILDAQ